MLAWVGMVSEGGLEGSDLYVPRSVGSLWEQAWQPDDGGGWAWPCTVSKAVAERCLGQNTTLTWDSELGRV